MTDVFYFIVVKALSRKKEVHFRSPKVTEAALAQRRENLLFFYLLLRRFRHLMPVDNSADIMPRHALHLSRVCRPQGQTRTQVSGELLCWYLDPKQRYITDVRMFIGVMAALKRPEQACP